MFTTHLYVVCCCADDEHNTFPCHVLRPEDCGIFGICFFVRLCASFFVFFVLLSRVLYSPCSPFPGISATTFLFGLFLDSFPCLWLVRQETSLSPWHAANAYSHVPGQSIWDLGGLVFLSGTGNEVNGRNKKRETGTGTSTGTSTSKNCVVTHCNTHPMPETGHVLSEIRHIFRHTLSNVI